MPPTPDSTTPAARIVDLFEVIHPLDRIPRAGYVLRGVTDPESVSAHSHFLAVLALCVTELEPAIYDRERLLAMALVHDLPEARLMDIPMPYADAYLRQAKQHAELAIAKDLFAGISEKLVDLQEEFEAAQTREAQLLRGLDKAQMMIRVLCYERERRGNLHEFWTNPKNFRDFGIKIVSDLFDEVCRRAGRERPVE